jgi:hypothetical protein
LNTAIAENVRILPTTSLILAYREKDERIAYIQLNGKRSTFAILAYTIYYPERANTIALVIQSFQKS